MLEKRVIISILLMAALLTSCTARATELPIATFTREEAACTAALDSIWGEPIW